MTLEHSQFAQDHIALNENFGYRKAWFQQYMGEYSLIGDSNEDGIVNAEDAADILTMAAEVGAGNVTHFSNAQVDAADVNDDGEVNALDSAVILMYSASLGAGERYVKVKDFT